MDLQLKDKVVLITGASAGIGKAAALKIAEAGAKILLTGVVGPKAAATLKAVGVRVVEGMEGLTVGQAVAKFQAEA